MYSSEVRTTLSRGLTHVHIWLLHNCLQFIQTVYRTWQLAFNGLIFMFHSCGCLACEACHAITTLQSIDSKIQFCFVLFALFVSDSQTNTCNLSLLLLPYFHLSHSVQALLRQNDQLYTTAVVTAILHSQGWQKQNRSGQASSQNITSLLFMRLSCHFGTFLHFCLWL